MSEVQSNSLEQMLKDLPGGIAKLALDDELTIIFATDTFYNLIEGIPGKINPKDTKSIFGVVFSADIINYTRQLAAQKHRKDNRITLVFRILQKNGNLKWIMINGSRSEEVCQTHSKTVPVYTCMVTDVTDHMLKIKQMEQEIEYHRTILELSKELYFEYEIASDTLVFTELFREVFGRDAEVKEFSKRLEKTKLIYPSDLPAVIKIFKSMMNGKKQAKLELRLISKEREAAWYTCYASIIFDENKNPYKVVGKLSATNAARKEKDPAIPDPQVDALTKVLTKDSAEKMIQESMKLQSPESLSAFMICEVRNYKGVNEIIRTVDGENILTTIAGFLKDRFRSSDIIGRYGLNEFAVYMKDIRSDKNAYEKAEVICREVRGLYSYEYNKNGLAISIGIAFTKGGQTEYQVLLQNAKAALVLAKKESTSSFEVFYPSLNSNI